MQKIALTAVIIISAGALLLYVNTKLLQSENQRRERRLHVVKENTVKEFTGAIEKLALVVKSLQAYVNEGEGIPEQQRLFDFLKKITANTEFDQMILLSVLDSNFRFVYAFDHKSIDPSNLIGKNLFEFTGKSAARKFDQLKESDELLLFKPHNLVEGKVGFSLNFRIVKEGKTWGYVIPIIDSKVIIDEVYQQSLPDEFVFHFSTAGGLDFDRERVYDKSRVYHDRTDPNFYKNFDLEPTDFIYENFSIYGLDLRIGVAYQESGKIQFLMFLISAGWFAFFATLIILIHRQSIRLEKSNRSIAEQRLKLQEQNISLNKANAAKNRFLSILAHDIKGPLQSINGFLSLNQAQELKSEDLRDYLGALKPATKNTINLVDTLLQWAKVNDGKVSPRFQEIDIQDLIMEVVGLYQSTADQKHITLETGNLSPEVISADRHMLSAIFRNILSNSLKFTPKHGVVSINLQAEDQRIEIAIQDSGIGMSPKEVREIFQLDKEYVSKGTEGELGTGLGMMLVKEYIEIHSGSIRVDSEPDKGSTFYVTLPRNPLVKTLA